MGAALEYPNDRVNWSVAPQEIEQNFYPALGFVNRQGIRQFDGNLRYRTRPRSQLLREIDPEMEVSLVTGMDGERQSQLVRLRPVRLVSRVNDSIYVEGQQNRELAAQDFTLFDRLLVPAADYTFEHVRVELKTGVQRALLLTPCGSESPICARQC